MKWIEVIEVRSVSSSREEVESQLRKLVEEVSGEIDRRAIKTFYRPLLDTDFAVHLIHESEDMDNMGSSLGQHLVSCFKESGLVSHRTWIEINS
jgi:hypothetical protein